MREIEMRGNSLSKMKLLDVNAVSGTSISLKDYTHILAYHACRAANEQCFRVQGLKPYTQTEALEEAVQKLESEHVDKDKIESIFYPLWDEIYASLPSRVWLMLNTKEFLGESSHYLIYGSEFLNVIAMELGCRDKLSQIGKPMIIKCAVPISEIPSIWLENLEQDILMRDTDNRSIAVSAVSPECIIDILYPTGYVRDPYSYAKINLG